ncbi:retrovirus-related Pol polyprotein from transposon TNT 1-94 [Trifolium medium]|uniref:Retrovirus-related Pol polyprotein from transposon TNT 1-94 n=1 Tax=Trifolium medium TaxID=97028 RepID=A0A392MJK5_9FABA|nr:retrovirus-related Pol polyprotein from transposon TNT 1-94 [Trifolium medium]
MSFNVKHLRLSARVLCPADLVRLGRLGTLPNMHTMRITPFTPTNGISEPLEGPEIVLYATCYTQIRWPYYDHWSMLMENLLRSKEYWSLIEEGVVVAPANATAEQRKVADESKLKDLKAKNYLFQAIDRTILETILNRVTARDIWVSMRQKYQGSTKNFSYSQ